MSRLLILTLWSHRFLVVLQVMLDTENKFVSTGMAKEIAAAAGGRYHYIPKASDKAIANVASQAMQGL